MELRTSISLHQVNIPVGITAWLSFEGLNRWNINPFLHSIVAFCFTFKLLLMRKVLLPLKQ